MSPEASEVTVNQYYQIYKLPFHMQAGVERYLLHGISGGSFLNAVLENDLVGAFARADDMNSAAMHNWVEWLYNSCPSNAWGSPEIVRDWCKKGGLKG